MKFYLVVLVAIVLLGCSARAEVEGEDWEVVGAAAPDSIVHLTIAVKQSNLHELERIFWEVSTPSSPSYGNFLTHDELSKLVMPSQESTDKVMQWLSEHGVRAGDVEFTKSRDFMLLSAPVSVASNLLSTKYVTYRHKAKGNTILKASSAYIVPDHLKEHVDFVSGHISFPLSRKPIYTPLADAPITPSTLRNRYNVTANLVGTNANNSYAVAEFQSQYYSTSDLQQFFEASVPYDPKAYTVDHVIGQNDPTDPGVEANLDIQFIMGVAPNVPSWFWSNPAFDFFSDIVNWLAQIDNTTDAPLIQSVSYGSQNQWPTTDIHNRVDIEFQKCGARGISIIFASGDHGTGCILCFEFKPSWPASSQYVTSVGATRFINGAEGAEMAVDEFGSGGGFSKEDSQPLYQAAAVAHYFKVQTDLPDDHFYNKSGRGTPDVAALGIGFQVYVGGSVESIGGTSASTPTFSAIVSLLNDIRLNASKPPLGFLNPWLYQIQASNPDAFWDVTEGNNQDGCCGITGFHAAPGWDPVTGLGTPNFAVLSKLV